MKLDEIRALAMRIDAAIGNARLEPSSVYGEKARQQWLDYAVEQATEIVNGIDALIAEQAVEKRNETGKRLQAAQMRRAKLAMKRDKK